MGARIIVQSGISAGSTHWMESSVVRLGSEPSADVCIPSSLLDPHALTIEYRDGEYRVYNRGSHQVFLGGRVLGSRQSSTWQDTDILELPDDVSLALDLDEDASPGPRPQLIDYAAFEEEPMIDSSVSEDEPGEPRTIVHTDSSQPGGAGFQAVAIQLTITGICVLGCVLLLARHQLRREDQRDIPRPAFDLVVRKALASGNEIPGGLLNDLQLAEAARVRGNTKLARKRYRQISMALMQTEPLNAGAAGQGDSVEPTPWLEVNHLVEYRLSQLGDD